MNVQELVALLQRRWKLVVAFLVLTVGGAAVLSTLATPEYQSTARIFVSSNVGPSGDAYSAQTFAAGRVQSYAQLAKSQPVTSQVVKKLRLKMTPAELADKISANVVTDTVLIDITVTDDTAKEAQRIARATSEQLTTYLANVETKVTKSQTGIKARITSPATLPSDPATPRTSLNLLVGVFLGLLAGIGVAVLVEKAGAENEELVDEASYDDEDDLDAVPTTQLNGQELDKVDSAPRD